MHSDKVDSEFVDKVEGRPTLKQSRTGVHCRNDTGFFKISLLPLQILFAIRSTKRNLAWNFQLTAYTTVVFSRDNRTN